MVRQNLYVYFPPYLAYISTHTHTYINITQLLRKTHIVTQKHAQRKADTTAKKDRQTKLVHYLCIKILRRDTQHKKAIIGQSELSVALM